MDPLFQQHLSEIEQFGRSNDRKTKDRSRKMLNITRDTGEFLSVIIRAVNARHVLEIGTSNGYSTLWLADACSGGGGMVTTVERSEFKFKMARQNFRRSRLSSTIHPILANAGDLLSESENNAYDFVFLDSERHEYTDWWTDLKRIIRPGGLLVADNAISHPEDMAPFMSLVASDPEFTTCLVPVGKGEYLAVRSS